MLLHGPTSTKCSMKYPREVTPQVPTEPPISLISSTPITARRTLVASIATTILALPAGAIEVAASKHREETLENNSQTFSCVCKPEQEDCTKFQHPKSRKAAKCTKNEEEYSYVVGSPNGPENWGNLNATWRLCGDGGRQSPINILNYKAVLLPCDQSLVTNYCPAQATIINRGHAIEVAWSGEDAGGIVINGSQYNVQQCHWHIPSEHLINGRRFDMELHIVHANSQKNLAVTAVLYRLGAPDPFLAQFTPLLKWIGEAHHEAEAGTIDPISIMFDTTSYTRYNGSLTTPPCSENVSWTVINHVKTVSRDQVRALQKAARASLGNARPVQPLNGRTIYLYKPTVHQTLLSF